MRRSKSTPPGRGGARRDLLAPLDPQSAELADSAPKVRSLFAYWEDRRGARSMPRRADIDPLDLPGHLAGIMLIDVEGETDDGIGIYRYRVVGTYEVDSRGHDPTGKLVEEGYFFSDLKDALRSYESVRLQQAPVLEPLSFISDRGVPIKEDSIMLPLSEDGESVSQILVYSERAPTD